MIFPTKEFILLIRAIAVFLTAVCRSMGIEEDLKLLDSGIQEIVSKFLVDLMGAVGEGK